MYLARVIGTVVATHKAEGMAGLKLLVVQPIDKQRQPSGEPHVAIDVAQAGEGDIVTCVGSREAALSAAAAHPTDPTASFIPVDAAIIGIVDDVQGSDAEPAAHDASPRGA